MDGSMPYKELYISSIMLLGSSSLFLAGFQGISFWHQQKYMKYSNMLFIGINGFMRVLNDRKDNLDNARKQFESNSLKESLHGLDKDGDYTASLDNSKKELDKLFDIYERSFKEAHMIVFFDYALIPLVVTYILGVIFISIYILLFMSNYVK